jgi:uncharacterized protein (DUF302 family)
MLLESGITTIATKHSVDEAVDKLKAVLDSKGVKIFAIVDHSGEAASVGLTLPPTKLVLFGNPKAGTPIMQAAPTAAIDLPLKILVAEDAAGNTSISWNSLDYLQTRHNIQSALMQNLAIIEALAHAAAQ